MQHEEKQNGEENFSLDHPRLIAGLVAIYLVPIALIGLNVIPFEWRMPGFFILLLYVIIIAIHQKFSIKELGIRFDNAWESIGWSLIITLISIVFLFIIFPNRIFEPAKPPPWHLFYPAYILVLAPAQEFFFRGFLFAEMDRLKIIGQAKQIAISALLFGYIHIIYRSGVFLLLALAVGAIWGALYYRHRNIFGVVIGHIILGIFANIFGIF